MMWTDRNFIIRTQQDLADAVRTLGIVPLFTLQSQCYVTISDFVYATDAHGLPYGWGIAEYATPERFMGQDFQERVYQRTPEESYQRIFEHLRQMLPDVSPGQIRRFLR